MLMAQGGAKKDTGAFWPQNRIPSDSALAAKPAAGAEFMPARAVNEADVKYKKRVWRRIDMRQKLNHYFTWQGAPLNQVIYEAGTKSKLPKYRTDSLASQISNQAIAKLGEGKVTQQIHNWRNPQDPTDLVDTTFIDKFDWKKIVKIEVMEDWIWDNVRGEYSARIIAIAPIMQNAQGKDEPMFWLKMKDLQPELKQHFVQTKDGRATKLNWDEVFNIYRLYDGYIVKSSSTGGKYLADMPEYMQNGEAALLSSEQMGNDLFIFQHDLWEY